jgi:hypothetical protein
MMATTVDRIFPLFQNFPTFTLKLAIDRSLQTMTIAQDSAVGAELVAMATVVYVIHG